MATKIYTLRHNRNCAWQRWILVALGTLLLCVGISGVSLWIDEGYSARLAEQPSLTTWASTLGVISGSEPQMPGYQLYLWLWARLFGTSELALRLANVPWAVLFTAALAWGAECMLSVRRTWLIVCLSPFMWFYMNEARPYAMLMGISMVSTIAVLAYLRDTRHYGAAPWWGMFSLLALWFTHMLAITLAVSLITLMFVLRPIPLKAFARQWSRPVIIALPLYLCLAYYYVQTLINKNSGMHESPSLQNLAYAVYEFLGFGGLGAPRNILRQHPSYYTLLPYCATLALGVLAIGLVAVAILLQIRRSNERRTAVGLSVSLVAGILATFALSFIAHFRLLGRHMSVFFALSVMLLLTGLLPDSKRRRPKVVYGALILLTVAWLVSDYRLRLLPNYQKDDYRSASALARNSLVRGEPVLWLADSWTARYYGLQTTDDVENVNAILSKALTGSCSMEWFQNSLKDRGAALVVISDREDVYDKGGKCRKMITLLNSEHIASYSNFNVWQVTLINRAESNTKSNR